MLTATSTLVPGCQYLSGRQRICGDLYGALGREPVRDVLVEADRDRLADAHHLAVVRQNVGRRQVRRRVRPESHVLARDAAEPEGFGGQRVLLVVAELFGCRPREAVRAEL